jgi:hypothetical protein
LNGLSVEHIHGNWPGELPKCIDGLMIIVSQDTGRFVPQNVPMKPGEEIYITSLKYLKCLQLKGIFFLIYKFVISCYMNENLDPTTNGYNSEELDLEKN